MSRLPPQALLELDVKNKPAVRFRVDLIGVAKVCLATHRSRREVQGDALSKGLSAMNQATNLFAGPIRGARLVAKLHPHEDHLSAPEYTNTVIPCYPSRGDRNDSVLR
jgi:hypothetical protein